MTLINLVVFYNNFNQINITSICQLISKLPNIKLCFVDNNSTDKTLESLQQIKALYPKQVAIVEIKKTLKSKLAIKAGLRFINNSYTFKKVVCIDANNLNNKPLENSLKEITL